MKDYPGIYLAKVYGIWVGGSDGDVQGEGALPKKEAWPMYARRHCWLAVKVPRLMGQEYIFCQPKSSFGGKDGLGRMELPQPGYTTFLSWVVGENSNAPLWEGSYWPAGSGPPVEARPNNRIILMDGAGNVIYAQDETQSQEAWMFMVGGKNVYIATHLAGNGGDPTAKIIMEESGKITIKNSAGAQIILDTDGTVNLN